jgi:hypothetical protein
MNAARKIQGRAANTVTRLSFQPKVKAIAIQPMVLQIEMIGKMPFRPIISWICFGSVARRETREPEAFSTKS